MSKLIILIGPSCTGKTTWVENYLKENNKTYVVSRDTERENTFGEYRMGSKKEEELITNIVHYKIETMLRSGDVIVDNTNLRREYLNDFMERFPNHSIEFIKMAVPEKEELIRRNQKRFLETGKLIPENVLHKQLEAFEELEIPSNIVKTGNLKTDPRLLKKYKYNNTVDSELPKCIICDLDGTLSMMDGRSPFDGHLAVNDKVNEGVASVLKAFSVLKEDVSIILFSGRNSDKGGLEATTTWLLDNGIHYDALHMRKEGDMRSDVLVKTDMFRENIKDQYQVLFTLDDRDCIVDLWRNMGIDTLQCYYGNF